MLSDEEEHRQLIDLIEKMLEYDPDRRWTKIKYNLEFKLHVKNLIVKIT